MPILEQKRGKMAQNEQFLRLAYESPALPLSYLAFSGERYPTTHHLICQYRCLNL